MVGRVFHLMFAEIQEEHDLCFNACVFDLVYGIAMDDRTCESRETVMRQVTNNKLVIRLFSHRLCQPASHTRAIVADTSESSCLGC